MMNRRTFFKGLAGLLAFPFLPKLETDDYITDNEAWFIKESQTGLGFPPYKREGETVWFEAEKRIVDKRSIYGSIPNG